jgi:hypothetical protein
VFGFGLYAQMVYGESMEEPPVGLVRPPGPPLPPSPTPSPPSPPGPACKVSALTNDSSILNHYCQTHAIVRTNGLCNIKCPSGALRADHCRESGWEKTIKELCGSTTTIAASASASAFASEAEAEAEAEAQAQAQAQAPEYPYPGCANPDNRSLSGMWYAVGAGSSSQLQGSTFNGQFFQRIR